MPERKAGRRPAVLMPNPFYNVYLGAAVLAGAEPVLLPVAAATALSPGARRPAPRPARAHRRLLPLLAGQSARRSPPTCAYLQRLIGLARDYGFLLIVDECYSEIYTRRSAARRARGGAGAGWPARRRARVLPLALQALERGRPAVGLRRGRCRRDRRPSPACAATAPRCSPCRCWRRRPRCGRTRSTSSPTARCIAQKFDLADHCWPAVLAIPSGRRLLPVARGRRRRGRDGAAVGRGRAQGAAGRLSRPPRRGRSTTRASARSGSPWCMTSRPRGGACRVSSPALT